MKSFNVVALLVIVGVFATGCEVSQLTWAENSGTDRDNRNFFGASSIDLNGETNASIIEVRFYPNEGCRGLLMTEAYTELAKRYLIHDDSPLWEQIEKIEDNTEFNLMRYTWDASGPTIKVVANNSDAALIAWKRCSTAIIASDS